VRKARALVKIPDDYLQPAHEITVAPAEVEDAFVKANPGLTRASVAARTNSPTTSLWRPAATSPAAETASRSAPGGLF